MTNDLALKAKFDLKELELNSLLEVTQAINNNLSEESLYKIYNFTIRGNLKIKKLALYVLDELWECKVNFGTEVNFSGQNFEDRFLNCNNIQKISPYKTSPFNEFQKVV